MPIYDENDTVITNGVQTALSRPDIIEIENRTLDGKRHIQTIGLGGTVLDVIAHFTMSQKLIFDNKKRTTSVIKVIFDSMFYIGIISGEPSYTRIGSTSEPIFTISFLLAVLTEGVV